MDMEDRKNAPRSDSFHKAIPSIRSIRDALMPVFNPITPELKVDNNTYLRGLYLEDVDFLYELLSKNREHLDSFLPWLNRLETPSQVKDFVKRARYKNVYEGRWVYGIC